MIVGCSKDARENTENENVKNGEPWSIQNAKKDTSPLDAAFVDLVSQIAEN